MPFVFRGNSLTIRGGPDTEGQLTLYVGPSNPFNASTDLFIAGPAANEMPLFIGPNKDFQGSGVLSLSITADSTGDFNNDGLAPLYIKSIANSGAPFQSTAPLRIISNEKLVTSGNTPLNIDGQMGTNNGLMTLLVPGDTASSSFPISAESETTLYIASYNTTASPACDLNIATDFNYGDTFTFYMKSTNPSGTAPLYTSGVGAITSNLSLSIRSPFAGDTTLYSIGYSE